MSVIRRPCVYCEQPVAEDTDPLCGPCAMEPRVDLLWLRVVQRNSMSAAEALAIALLAEAITGDREHDIEVARELRAAIRGGEPARWTAASIVLSTVRSESLRELVERWAQGQAPAVSRELLRREYDVEPVKVDHVREDGTVDEVVLARWPLSPG